MTSRVVSANWMTMVVVHGKAACACRQKIVWRKRQRLELVCNSVALICQLKLAAQLPQSSFQIRGPLALSHLFPAGTRSTVLRLQREAIPPSHAAHSTNWRFFRYAEIRKNTTVDAACSNLYGLVTSQFYSVSRILEFYEFSALLRILQCSRGSRFLQFDLERFCLTLPHLPAAVGNATSARMRETEAGALMLAGGASR
jgi:hypothetical protein